METTVRPTYVMMRRQTAKVWRLYDDWQRSKHREKIAEKEGVDFDVCAKSAEIDYSLYMDYRGLVEKAIADGPAAWKDEFILP